MATLSTRPLADTIRAKADQDGIKFFFAQFVDMNAKPSAKLVPVSGWDGLVSEGAGFAGFAAGPMGQSPASRSPAAPLTATSRLGVIRFWSRAT